MEKIYAPVMITTICRYEKFKRCVESLSRCTDADKTEVFIGVDYPAKESHWEGYRKIREFLPAISGFKNVNIFIREENLGQGKNGKDLRDRMKVKYDRFIMSEDDNEFSPNFLQYMNQCLEKYKDDNRVLSVCGYSYIEWEKNLKNYTFNALPLKGYCAWGAGFWFDKNDAYKLFRMSGEQILRDKKIVNYLFSVNKHKLIHYLIRRHKGNNADILRACLYSLTHKYSIYPKISKVKNCGFDKSATNCAELKKYSLQEIDHDTTFHLDEFDIEETKQLKQLHDIHYGINIIVHLLARFEYFQWRITGNSFSDYTMIRNLIRKKVKFQNKKYEE